MPSNNFKKWVQAYDRGQAAKNELEQAQNRYKQSKTVTAKASRKLTNAGYKMARSKYLQDQEAIGGGGVGVGGVDQLGNAMGRQSGAVDFRNNLIVGRLANADYTGTYSNLRNNNTFLTEQAQRIAQQREAGNKGRTAMLKSKAGRFTLGAVEGLGSGLSFGMTERGGNAIQNWQEQGATNLTDTEALEAQNSGTYKAGRVVGEMSSYLIPYGMTHELAGKVASKLKVDKLMSKAVEKIGGKTLTRMAENELGRNLARTEAKRLAGKVVAGELTEDAAKKSILKGVTKQAGKKTLDATRAEIKQRLSHELARDFVQDVALGNVQDIAMAYNRGEKITPQFLIANNLMNLGIGGLVDVAPALKGLKNIDAERVTGRELGKALKTAEPEKVVNFKTPAQRSAAQSFDDVMKAADERANLTKELADLTGTDEATIRSQVRQHYEAEIANGVTDPATALRNAQRRILDERQAGRDLRAITRTQNVLEAQNVNEASRALDDALDRVTNGRVDDVIEEYARIRNMTPEQARADIHEKAFTETRFMQGGAEVDEVMERRLRRTIGENEFEGMTARSAKETDDLRIRDDANNVYAEDIGAANTPTKAREALTADEAPKMKAADRKEMNKRLEKVSKDYFGGNKEIRDEMAHDLALLRAEKAKANPDQALVSELLDKIERDFVNNKPTVVMETVPKEVTDEIQSAAKDISARKYFVSSQNKGDVVAALKSDNWADARKAHYNSIDIADGGHTFENKKNWSRHQNRVGVDTAYLELRELHPTLFPEADTIQEMVENMKSVVDDARAIRNKSYKTSEMLVLSPEDARKEALDFRRWADETTNKNATKVRETPDVDDIPQEEIDSAISSLNKPKTVQLRSTQGKVIPTRPNVEPKPQKTFKKVPHLEGKDKLIKFKVGEKEAQRITQNKVYAKAIDDPKFWSNLQRQGVTPEMLQAQAKYQGRPAAAVLTDYAKVYDLNNRKIDTIAERVKLIKDIDAEAKKALTEYASLDIPRSELFGAPADVKIKGQKLEKLPTSQKELEKMQEQIGQTLVDDDYTTPIVSSFKPDGTSAGDRWREYLYGMKKRWFDSGQAFYEFGKKNKDVLLYAYFDNFRNYRGQAESMIGGNGHWSGALGKETQDCKSLGQIFDPIYKANAADDFNEYMFHRHNIKRMEYEKPVMRENGEWVTAERSKQRIRELEKKHGKLFKQQAEEIYKYEKTLTKMEVEAGLLTEGHADYLWKIYPDYVPTHRDIAKLDGLGASVSNRRVKARRQSKGAIGSDLPLIRLEEQLVSRTNQTCQACALNDLGVRLLANVDDPHMIRSIREINTEDIIKGWEDDFNSLPDLPKDIPLKGISEEDGKYFFDISTQSRAYRIEIDKELYKALEVQTKTTPEIKALSKINKVFKDLVTTYNPFFGLVRNPARDILDSFSFSKYGTRSYLASYKDAIGHMIRRDSTWQMYKSLYGAGESVYDLARGYKKHSWLRRNTLDRIAQVNGAIENMGRFAAYLDTLKHEGDGMDAIVKGLHNAREVTVNFGRSGTVGRVLNKNFVPFFNAGVQDVVRIGRAVKEGRLGTLLVGAAMLGIGPSVINELIYAGDEDYQRLRQSDKDLNFLIKIGDGRFLKIPKGRVGSVIAMPAQRTARLLTGNAKDGDAYKGMGKIAIEQIAPVNPVTNNIFAPLVGAATNRTWYGGEIESSYLQKLPAGERSDENTTPWAKWLGEKLNLSPKKIDYVLNQYSGVLGQAGKSFVPSKRGSNPVLNMAESNFIIDAVTNNELSTKFYEEYNKAEQTKNSSKGTRSDKIYYKYLEKIKGTTSPYTVDVKEYLNDTDLNYSEKRGKVRDARRQQNKLYEDALNKKNAMKAAIEKWDGQLKVQDYKTDSAYDNDVYQHALMDVYGPDKALEMTDAEKYDKVKAAKWTPQGYMNAKTASGKYSNGMAKSMVAMDNGANTYEKAKLIDSSITESQYEKAKILKRAGISAEKADALTSERTLHKIDTDGSGRRSTAEIMAFLDRSGYTREQKRQMWYLYANKNWKNPYA